MIWSQLMSSVHMLTATSQGVRHWAGYQQQITLMFEVFGEPNPQLIVGHLLYTLLEYLLICWDNNSILYSPQ